MITIICGPVKAGKSKKLIEYYEQLKGCGVFVFSSKFSLTNGEDIVSRYGTQIKAIPINNLWDIPHHVVGKFVKHILVDEFQFLQMSTQELKKFIEEYYDKIDMYFFGLNRDYKNDIFKLMSTAMAYADKIVIIGGYCDFCGLEPTRYSLRLENDEPANLNKESQVILLDGNYENAKIEYKTICEKCWNNIYRKKEDNV